MNRLYDYTVTFSFRGKRPTLSQIEYYLIYWIHDNATGEIPRKIRLLAELAGESEVPPMDGILNNNAGANPTVPIFKR